MSWRFKVSKYKNVAPEFPKKEQYISDIPVGRLMSSCGNHISAGCTYMAFNTDTRGGGNVGILPLETSGRQGQSLPMLTAHSDFVNDMSFSPFDDSLLATCSSDNMVKIWSLPDVSDTLSDDLLALNPTVTLPAQERRVENVLWHPTASGVLGVSVDRSIKVFDANTGDEKYNLSCHEDHIQGFSWHGNGTLIVTACKDTKIRVLDPRTSAMVEETVGHTAQRDSRVVWLGDSDFILSTGFSANRDRETAVWDSRKMSACLQKTTIDKGTGILMPLYDEDTNMLYLIGKADGKIGYFEVTTASPYIVQNSSHPCEQLKGACLIPKRAVHVMEGEVDRLLLMTQNYIIPAPCIVPRRQYKDFHADVFPDTKTADPALTADQWFDGENGQVAKMSLDPAKKGRTSAAPVPVKTVQKKSPTTAASSTSNTEPSVQQPAAPSTKPVQQDTVPKEEVAEPTRKIPETVQEPSVKPTTETVLEPSLTPTTGSGDDTGVFEEANQKPNIDSTPKTFNIGHQSKCKYLKGVIEHKSKHIENLRRLCRTLPGESDLFYTNTKRCSVPIEGAGGLVGILELDKPGRLPDTGVPVLQNGSKVNDMAWDPFDNSSILVGCEDAKIYGWKIPEGGLTETLTEPEVYLSGHTEKIYSIKFHPLAKDIILTTSYDNTVKIWDLTDNTDKLTLKCHDDQIFCAEWSPDGKLIATVCKDGKIRIIDPRKGVTIKEGAGPNGSRGARISWALNMTYLIVSGFHQDKQCLLAYNVSDISEPLEKVFIGRSPAILVPYYDEGTSTLFITARGDGRILTFEVSEEYPHLFPLSPVSPDNLHQGLSLMPTTMCDVKKIEFARAWRLTQSSIEPMSFTVPRVKPEYFQDDLFPDTQVKEKPVLTSQEWFSGVDRQPKKISLRPSNMKLLSEAPVEAPKPKKYDSFNPDTYKTDDEKKEELLSAITGKLEIKDEPLPQDTAEGVDSDEWGDD